MPSNWNIAVNGVYWNGLNPKNKDTDYDGMNDSWKSKNLELLNNCKRS